jgi:arginine decarboxylase
VLTPAQTYQKLIKGETERLRFQQMAGRIAAVMLVPYPPGIPMSMPGERLGGPNTPVMRLMMAMEEFGKRFPGFEREVHGIEVDEHGEYWMRAVIEQPTGHEVTYAGQAEPPSATPKAHNRLSDRPVRRSSE